jgi:hypothetical protein
MSEPLTREQIAEELHKLYLAKAHDLGWPVRHECDVPYDRLTPDGQALDLMFADWHLAQLATVTAERDEVLTDFTNNMMYQDQIERLNAELLAQLAAMTAERDEAVRVARGLAECGVVNQGDIDWATAALNLCRKDRKP